MEIKSKSTENHELTFDVTVTPEEFAPFKRQASRKIASQAKIPGFRPGKAPHDVILRMYGEEAVAQEALDIYLEKEYSRIIDEAGIEPGGMGSLTKVESFDPPAFTLRIPIAPTVDLGDYREIREDYQEVTVTQEEIDGTIKEILTSFATVEPTEDPITDNSQVSVLIKGNYPEVDPDTGSDVYLAEMPYDYHMGAVNGTADWPVAGFAKNLIGKKAGDVVTTEMTFTKEDASVESMIGKTVIFTTTIQSVKKMILPELDLEIIKEFGEFESVEAFLEDVKKRLQARKESEHDNAYIEKLTDKIVAGSKIDFAPVALENEAQEMFANFKNRVEQQGFDIATYFKILKTDPETFLNEKIRPDAENQLKRRLVIQEFARAEKIKLNFESFKEIVAALQQSAGYEYAQAKTKKAKDAIMNRITDQAMNEAFSESIFKRMIAIGKGENPEIEPAVKETESGNVTVDSNETLTPEA